MIVLICLRHQSDKIFWRDDGGRGIFKITCITCDYVINTGTIGTFILQGILKILKVQILSRVHYSLFVNCADFKCLAKFQNCTSTIVQRSLFCLVKNIKHIRKRMCRNEALHREQAILNDLFGTFVKILPFQKTIKKNICINQDFHISSILPHVQPFYNHNLLE